MERLKRFTPFLPVLLAVGLYLNALPGRFVLDDHSVILENPAVAGGGGLLDVLAAEYGRQTDLWRPVTLLAHYLLYGLFGPDPFWHHLASALLHGAVVFLLGLLVKRLTGDGRLGTRTALLFAAHPIHTEAVAYVSGLAELLAALGFLAAYLVYLSATTPEEGGVSRRGRFIIAALLLFLAVASKENAAALFGVVLAGDLLFRRGGISGGRLARTAALFVAPVAFYLFLKYLLLGRLLAPGTTILNNPAAHAALWERWATASEAAFRYLALLLWPARLSCDYGFDAVPVVRGVAGAAAFILAALASAAAALFLARRHRPALFALLWFLVTYFPVSNIPFPIGVIMAERLLYLPSAGFCLLAAVCLGRLDDTRFSAGGRTSIIILTLVLLLWGGRTVLRNLDWRGPLPLFASAVKAEPRSVKARANLAVALSAAGRLDEALRQLDEALRIAPRFRDGRRLRALTLYEAGRREEGTDILKRLTGEFPDEYEAPYRLGRLLLGEGRPREAIAPLRTAVSRRPEYVPAWSSLGVALSDPRVRDLAGAQAALDRAYALQPLWPGLRKNRGLIYMNLGEPCRAIEELEAARRAEKKEDPTVAMALKDARRQCRR